MIPGGLKIGNVEIGYPNPARTVAEISNNHNGDYDRCVRLIHAAKNAGADIVKFQAYTPLELVQLRGDGPAPAQWGEQGWTMFDLYDKAKTPLAWFEDLIEECNRVEIPWFSSVFGPISLATMDKLGCEVFKLAALDFGKRKFTNMVADIGKPLVRSSSAPKAPERKDAAYLYCPKGYPQGDDFPLRQVRWYDGFSYHGTDPAIPAMTVGFGAKLIECHFQLDDEPSELEANISLTASQFATMVEYVRRIELR